MMIDNPYFYFFIMETGLEERRLESDNINKLLRTL